MGGGCLGAAGASAGWIASELAAETCGQADHRTTPAGTGVSVTGTRTVEGWGVPKWVGLRSVSCRLPKSTAH